MCEKNVVLSLDSGTNFPLRPGSLVQIKAKLDNVLLQTDRLKLTNKNPLFECELVWETSKALLTALRTKRACVRVDVLIDDKLLGYLVLDVRSSPVVSLSDDPPASKAHALQGAGGLKPCPALNAVLYIETDQASPAPKSSKQINTTEYTQKKTVTDSLKPVLLEDAGYFQIGEVTACQLFHLKVAVLRTENLHMLNTDPDIKDEFKIVYDLLGTELEASPGEIATAKLNSNKQNLVAFLSSYGIQMNIIQHDKVVGTADIDISSRLNFESGNFPVQYTGECPVIASYNLTTPRDKDGHYPYLMIFLYLDILPHNPSPSAIDHQSIDLSHVSEGELSDAISESIHQQSIIVQQQHNQAQQQPQNQQQLPQQPSTTATAEEVQNPQINLHESAFRTIETPPVGNAQAENVEIQNPQPTKTGSLGTGSTYQPSATVPGSNSTLRDTGRDISLEGRVVPEFLPQKENRGPEQLFPQSPPTKLPREASIVPEESSLLPGDETDYKSPPISRPSTNQNTFEFAPDVKLPRKMIISVENIRMLYNYSNIVLWYEYPHLSSSRITTEVTRAPAGELISITDGSMEYNFMSSQVQLTSVFMEYKLKINVISFVGVNQQQVGVCTLGLDQVLLIQADNNSVKRKKEELTIVSDKGVVGYLNLALSLQTFSPRQSPRNNQQRSSPPSRKSLEQSLSFGSINNYKASKKTVNPSQPLQSKENVNVSEQIHQQRRQTSNEQNTSSHSRAIKDRLLEMEILAQVAKELETWKLNEQKKFKEDLAKKESQQMSLLGREWQDREKARVEEYNTRLESLRNKEQQLQTRMEQADNREKELDAMKKSLEEDQSKLKQGKLDTIQKLRKDLKAKETEASQKDSELQVTKEKLKSVEQELNRIKNEKEKKKDLQASLQTELRKSKDDVIKLETQLEIRTKELQLMETQKNNLFKENQDLKSEQQTRMSELLNHLKLNKDEPVLMQGGLQPVQNQKYQKQGPGLVSSGTSPRLPTSGRSGVTSARSSNSRTPDTQIEMRIPVSSTSPPPTSARSKPTTPREVQILRDVQRLERDRDMMIRAGYPQDDDVIRMFEEKISTLYVQLKNNAEKDDK